MQLLARDLGAITDAVDLELALEALVTPLTMLATSARTMPCLARFVARVVGALDGDSWPSTLIDDAVRQRRA